MTDTEMILIARGRTAEVMAWNDQQVLKLFYAGISPDSIMLETRAARLVSAMNLPTPRLLGVIMQGDRYGLIYERVEGESLLACLGTRPWLCIRYARQFAELHTAIHRQRGTGMPPLKPSLENTICGLKGLPPGLLETALDRLARLPEGEMLCHLDFHPEQVMVTATGQFVLDWRIEGEQMHLHVTIPANTTALLTLPRALVVSVTEKGIPLGNADGVLNSVQAGTDTAVDVGSGCYSFEYAV